MVTGSATRSAGTIWPGIHDWAGLSPWRVRTARWSSPEAGHEGDAGCGAGLLQARGGGEGFWRRPWPRCRPRVPRYGVIGAGPVRCVSYLGQYGRAHRADQIPPAGFWAAATHAHPGDLAALGTAARVYGLYRDAAQL